MQGYINKIKFLAHNERCLLYFSYLCSVKITFNHEESNDKTEKVKSLGKGKENG